jgi:hypothetical protein
MAAELGALGGTRTPNLLIRSSMCGRPDPFRPVRDLGCVSARCSFSSGFPGGCSSWWLPGWLPGDNFSGCPRGGFRQDAYLDIIDQWIATGIVSHPGASKHWVT